MDVRQLFLKLRDYLNNKVIGQEKLIDSLLISLLSGGHILIEGQPGLAKTRVVKLLAASLQAQFKRIQFTSDLLPGDITGTEIYKPNDGEFIFYKGPIFSNLILADEFNRAPAKVQSALLESMAENQVSVGGNTFSLPDLFMILATQNSKDEEGVYQLSSAQLDRFFVKTTLTFPSKENEKKILKIARKEENQSKQLSPTILVNQSDLIMAKKEIQAVYMAESIEDYIIEIIDATRDKNTNISICKYISNGISSRGIQALDKASRAYAWLYGRNFVSPEDVKTVASDVLSHRIQLTINSIAKELTADMVLKKILEKITVS